MILSRSVRRTLVRPLLLSAIAVLGGLPAYLLADHFRLLPLALRDRPWPFEAVVLLATVAIGRGARASSYENARPVMVACTVAGVVALFTLVIVARVTRFSLRESPRDIQVGATLPRATVRDEKGSLVELTSLVGRPMLLVFYRGGWCPSCRAQLTALLPEVERFLAAGVSVVGISPDPPEISARWSRELGLPFPLLSDETQRLAPTLCGGSAHCQLLVDKEGTIRWGALSDSWRMNPPPSAVLQAAYRLR
jgi:peroxiredoxin